MQLPATPEHPIPIQHTRTFSALRDLSSVNHLGLTLSTADSLSIIVKMSPRVSLLHPPPWLHRFVILPLSLLHFTFRDLFQGTFIIRLILPSFPASAIPPLSAIAPAAPITTLPAVDTVVNIVEKGFAHRWRWHFRFVFLFAYLFGLRVIHIVLREWLSPEGHDDSSIHHRRCMPRRAKRWYRSIQEKIRAAITRNR